MFHFLYAQMLIIAHLFPVFFRQDLTKYSDDGETIPYLSDLVTSLVKVKEVLSWTQSADVKNP